jgi:hypothetical protein
VRSSTQVKDEEPLPLTEGTPSRPAGQLLSKKQEGPSSDLSIIIERLQTVRACGGGASNPNCHTSSQPPPSCGRPQD